MLPFSPTFFVRQLTPSELEPAQRMFDRMLMRSIYSRSMSVEELREQLFAESPSGLFPVRWQTRATFALLRVGDVIGLLDAAVGLDSESTDLPDYQPLGLLRLMVLPDDAEMVQEAAHRLITSVEDFWRRNGVGRAKAYHVSTGYPQWQAGIGTLSSDWTDQVRLLNEHGYQYAARVYCFFRPLQGELFEESAPQTALSLVFRGDNRDRRYQVFFRRTELVGEARVVQCIMEQDGKQHRIAHLVHWDVDERWRNQNIGRWMLRRIVNDASQQSLEQIILFVRMHQAAAINLIGQHGFVEHAYRGYAFEKTLRA